MALGKSPFDGRIARHHNFIVGARPITGPIKKGNGKGNTAGGGHGKGKGGGGAVSTDYKLLLNMEGSEGGNTFVDHSSYNRPITLIGSPTTTAAAAIDGTTGLAGDLTHYLQIPASSDWAFGANQPFTIMGWAKNAGQYPTLVGVRPTSTPTQFWINANASEYILKRAISGDLQVTAPSLEGVNHIALSRNASGVLRWRRNGRMIDKRTMSEAITDTGGVLSVGGCGGLNTYSASVDEVVIAHTDLFDTDSDVIIPSVNEIRGVSAYGSAAAISATDWGLLIDSGNTGSFISVGEIQFLDASDNVLSSGGTVTASSFRDANWLPAEAFNGSTGGTGDGWFVNPTFAGNWIRTSLASPITPAKIRIWPNNEYASTLVRKATVAFGKAGKRLWPHTTLDIAAGVASTSQTFTLSNIPTPPGWS